ncbi:uncharacterized protein LOC111626157 [Centruroides sculpturatus]|uniref:uncharacterized protein LOC111626157 n=1 Tax=Centruroides sculpturatus TaxID=218467 RepID=UPI000C6D3D58|nr:uncharacterized protein LOC111626157 [Centruroides sculpturatus]
MIERMNEPRYKKCLNEGDCLNEASLDLFHSSPGGYDPNKKLDPWNCKTRCGDLWLPYTGILQEKYCLCSKNKEVESMETMDEEDCKKSNLAITYYKSIVIVPITGLTIKASEKRIKSSLPVDFTVNIETGENVEYTVTFGDGNFMSFTDDTSTFTHYFYHPGIFKVTVSAKPRGAPETYRVAASTVVTVISDISENGVTFLCPTVVKPKEIFACNLTVTTGVKMSLKQEYGDKTKPLASGLPDTKAQKIGIDIPRNVTPDMVMKKSDQKLIIIPDSQIYLAGLVHSLQLFGTEEGPISLLVLRRKCQNKECSSAYIECQKENVYCPHRHTCLSPVKDASCPQLRSVFEFPFSIVHKIPINIKAGHNYLPIEGEYKVETGDILGVYLRRGQVAYRRTLGNEQDDFGGSKLSKSSGIKDTNVKSTGLKYYLQAAIGVPLQLSLQHRYRQTNVFEYSIEVNNEFTSTPITRKCTVNVQRPILGIKLTVTPPDTATGQVVKFELVVNGGTNVNVVWDFGDEKIRKEYVDDTATKGKLTKEHVYREPGVYKIKVRAFNLHGEFNDSHRLIAQNPVLPVWEISTNSPQLLPATISINLNYPKTEKLPTNSSAIFKFGDKATLKWDIPKEGEGISEVFQHAYKKPGIYKVSVKIFNLVTSKVLTTEVEVADYITGLSVKAFHIPHGGKRFLPGFGLKQDKFPVDRNVTLFMGVKTGDVELYIIELLEDGTILKNDSDSTFTYDFQQPGHYNLSIFAYNHVHKNAPPIKIHLHMMEPVLGLDITDHYNLTDEEEDKFFEINLEQLGTDTCLVIDYGDGSILHAFGAPVTCFINYTRNDILWEEEKLSTPHFVKHHYRTRGEYYVLLKAFNDVSETNATLVFTIVDLSCKPPILDIRNRASKANLALENYRSIPVVLYSYTTVRCNVTTEAFRMWRVWRVNETTGMEIEQIDISMLDSCRKSMLFIKPFFLESGYYRFVFQVNMTGPSDYPMMPFRRSIDTYVNVVPSPVIVQMSDGAQTRVTRGWGQKLRLDPGTYSVDPDDVDNKNFTITWYCRRVPHEVLNRSMADEFNISNPIYDRNSLYIVPPTDDGKPGIEEEDQGGCFGKGPGRINVTDSYLEWDTTVFRKTNITYEIIVKVELPDRDASWGGIQIVLLEHVPPAIAVRCQTEKLCYPHDPIGQKINPVRVGLIGLCTENCEGQLTYQWELYGVEDEGNETYLEDAARFLVGANEQKMALSEEFFKEYYPAFGDFIAKLAVENEANQKGESDLFLHINKPPENGNCTLYPEEGKALLDTFTAICLGWIDPEGSEVDYYAYWTMDLQSGVVFYLSYGPDEAAELVLPYGAFQLGVDIKDKEGALTKLNITTLALTPPTKQEYEQFMATKQLEYVEASGDQAKMNQVSQAVSSLMNIRLPSDQPDSSENEIPDEPDADKELEEKTQARLKMVRSVDSVMNMDTLSGLEQIGSALTAIAGNGDALDNDGKNAIIRLLNKTVELASDLKVEAPQQLLDFCMYAVGTMGGIVARMSQQLVEGVVMPSDRTKALDIEYDIQAPLYGEEEKESLFDGKIPFQEALAKVIIEQERVAAEGQIKQIVDLTIQLVLTILRNIVVGEEPLEFIAPSGLGLTISMFKGGTLSNMSIQHGDATYIFPEVCDILSQYECSGNETLGVMAVSWPAILQSFGDSVDLLSKDTQTLQLLMLDETLHLMSIKNTTGLFGIIIPRKSGKDDSPLPEPTYVLPTMKWYEQMVYHQFFVEKADSAVNIEIHPTEPDSSLTVFIKHREKPLLNYYDLMIPLETVRNVNGTYDIFLPNDVIQNKTGFFYVGVVEGNDSLSEEMLFDSEHNFTKGEVSHTFSTNYTLRIYTSGCYFFNPDTKIWSGEGCFVENSNKAMTYCKCNHLTSFGGGFFVTPNTVDFAYVFANAGFADNVTIYMTIIVTLLLYIILLIWARRQDKKDTEKLGATPLPDNDPQDRYLYEMTVFTGDKDAAATDSQVHFILSGEDDETSVRTFGDSKRKIFRRGAMDTFVMSVARPLGKLNYIRIWHDNKGKGKFRSWFLSFIVVRDVQTGAKFEFVVNKWLAVEKDDGLIDRLVPVAGKGEATEFSHLFNVTTQKNLSDGHLWFSIFLRPPRSRFTRVQRVSSCMAMLYLSMLVNAMWYGRVPSKPSGSAINIGPFSMSPEQIGVGVMANLIVFPPTFLMITLFRKSRLRKLRPSRITEALKKQNEKYKPAISLKRPGSGESTMKLVDDDASIKEVHDFSNKSDKKKKKKKFLFPWWCRYVAWLICLASIFVSVFFLWAYGVQFGDEKTKKWVTSLLISFFTSILITQPIKVFLVAMILSSLFKSVDSDEDDSEQDEEAPNLADDEEWLHTDAIIPIKKKISYQPPNSARIEKARREREKELKMAAIIKEIFSYVFFLWILIILSYGNRDPNAFFLKTNLENAFIKKGDPNIDFTAIGSTASFWKWAREGLIPELLVGKWYNGDQPFGLRGFIDDRVNRLMGYGVLRQVRIKPNSCKVEEIMKNVSKTCRGYSRMVDEDKRSYQKGWKKLSEDDGVVDEYHYRSSSELDGLPFFGKLDVYGGGGYVVPLRGSREQLKEELYRLEKEDWTDAGTRAVFAEFSVYNAQVNLFGVIELVAEFQPGGGVVPFHRIDAIRLMRYHQGFGLFVMICELTYVIYTIYFTVREAKKIRKDRKEYFQSYWNLMEVAVVSLSYASIIIYIYRMIVTKRILKVFEKTEGNGYVKLQFVASVDEVFGYLMAFLIFISILKFIKLLRFNKRMGVLYSTLQQCSKDLKSFFIVFGVIYFAFVQMFYIVFGVTLQGFKDFITSTETAFSIMRGVFDFEEICLASPLLGPIMFFVYALVTSVILLNIFVTLIISAFQSVKEDIQKQNNEYEIVSFMFKKFKGMFGFGDNDPDDDTPDDANQVNTLGDKIHEFPGKVDKLLHYMNNFYFDGQLDVTSKKVLHKICNKGSEIKTATAKKFNKNNYDSPNFLDWQEIDDEL